ncbi:hypothetical protein [Georgenia sp. SUBG003]|uniref:hypothetical protein n=1 Tax=Georgenia sp. SUBG003 TaxID=1497974 RepID=UPI003AB28E1F
MSTILIGPPPARGRRPARRDLLGGGVPPRSGAVPRSTESALRSSPGVAVYLQYVDAVGLGWSMTTQSELDLPAYSGTMQLQHAEVLEDA